MPATPAVPIGGVKSAHPILGSDEDEELPTAIITAKTREAARKRMAEGREPSADAPTLAHERLPPHTPPEPSALSINPEKPPAPEEPPPTTPVTRPPPRRFEAMVPLEDDDDELRPRTMSPVGLALMVILVLLAGGLVAASLALEGSPDPRPLLEKFYRQYF